MVKSDNKKIIVALDYSKAADALNMADQLDPTRCRLKVGKELFTYEGPAIVRSLHEKGFDVFLDLKFHDIPNTTAAACAAAADLGIWMVNVHASGGRRMMEAARKAVDSTDTLLIGVTVLTSMESDDLAEVGVSASPKEQVSRLADLAHQSGLDGLVCSAHEASAMRETYSENFCLVTPGVRPAGAEKGDQRRVMTPAEALNAGSSYLVIGRPITQADSPIDAFDEIYREVSTV
ncbi:orotidine-5'-phosphate decarboxylase [Pseudomonadota bacterium]